MTKHQQDPLYEVTQVKIRKVKGDVVMNLEFKVTSIPGIEGLMGMAFSLKNVDLSELSASILEQVDSP